MERALPAQQIKAVAAAGSRQGSVGRPPRVRQSATVDIAPDAAACEGDGIIVRGIALSGAAGMDDTADDVVPDAAAADKDGVETGIGYSGGRRGTAAGDTGDGTAGDADQVVPGRAVKQA